MEQNRLEVEVAMNVLTARLVRDTFPIGDVGHSSSAALTSVRANATKVMRVFCCAVRSGGYSSSRSSRPRRIQSALCSRPHDSLKFAMKARTFSRMSGPQKAILSTVRSWNRSRSGHHACEGSSLVEKAAHGNAVRSQVANRG
jgi:hypothetical protein